MLLPPISTPTIEPAIAFMPIAGFPGCRVGDNGSVWSRWQRRGTKVVMGDEWRLRKPAAFGERGYLRVVLLTAEGKRPRLVARLVLEAFVGPPPPDGWANYEDGNTANVAATNLTWKTREMAKAGEITRGTRNHGVRNGLAKLTDAEVRDIRAEYAGGGVTQASIAARRELTSMAVSLIVRRKRWKHVT